MVMPLTYLFANCMATPLTSAFLANGLLIWSRLTSWSTCGNLGTEVSTRHCRTYLSAGPAERNCGVGATTIPLMPLGR